MSLNGLNILQGERLTKKELVERLIRMNVTFNENISQKSYYVDKYNEHIQNITKQVMIIDKLISDDTEEKNLLALRKERRNNMINADIDGLNSKNSKFLISRDQVNYRKAQVPLVNTSHSSKQGYQIDNELGLKERFNKGIIEEKQLTFEFKPKPAKGIQPEVNSKDLIRLKHNTLILHDKYDNQIPFNAVNTNLDKNDKSVSSNIYHINNSLNNLEINKPLNLNNKKDNISIPVQSIIPENSIRFQKKQTNKHQTTNTFPNYENNSNEQTINMSNNYGKDHQVKTSITISQKNNQSSIINKKSSDDIFKYAIIALGAGVLLTGGYYCIKYNYNLLSFSNKIRAISKTQFTSTQTSFKSFFSVIFNKLNGSKTFISSSLYSLLCWLGLCLLSYGKKYFWANIYYFLGMFVFKIVSFYLWKQIKKRQIVKAIFVKIKQELLKISNESDDIYAGLTESDIIKKYFSEYGYTEIEFQNEIMPKLRDLRAKDDSIKEFDERINGKIQRLWQWSFH